MTQNYDLSIYWNDRCKIYGHTGYADELIYSYDQPLRIRAINKALSWSKIVIDKNTKVLDIGCGTGDLLLEFAKRGANLTGIDISNEVILKTKEIFLKEKINNAILFAMKVEEMKFAPNTFDLVTCITVLQHIVNERLFPITIKKIVDVVKDEGYILILEISPYKKNSLNSNALHYITIRSREEYINAFKAAGCGFINEIGIPQVGIKFLQYFSHVLKMARYIYCLFPASTKTSIENSPHENAKQSDTLPSKLYKSIQRLILKTTYPMDYLLLPSPKKYTNYRILIFQKNG